MRFAHKISARLLFGFAVAVSLMLVLGYSSIHAIGGLGGALDTAVNRTSQKLQLVGDLRAGFQEMRVDAARLEISMDNLMIGRLDRNSGCGSCHTPDTVETQEKRFAEVAVRLRGRSAELGPLVSTAEERQAVGTVESGITEWLSLYRQYLKSATDRDFTGAHQIMLDRIYPLVESMDKAAEQLAVRQRNLLAESSRAAHSQATGSRTLAIILMGLCLLAGGGVHWTVRGATRLLRQLAGQIANLSGQVTTAARQLSSGSQALAEGACEQAASLQQTTASAEQVRATAQSNSGHCHTVREATAKANQQVREANQSLAQMLDSMQAISVSSGKISQIIKTIDGIAFQTNILALNAAVEAARAGQAGMGFAVVADEVRGLAQRCAQAARDTSVLIEESIGRSREGSARLEQVAQAVGGITAGSAEVQKLIQQVAASSGEQSLGIEQMSKALAQIDQVTQKTAQSAEENAAAGHELSAQAGALHELSEKLNSLV
ncbi:MAG TPA: methyl-accepting chemotaxis protein [Bryobacteraceae bacterium]|nr:methyl-accepting chemotaxis protein [Bryobacteraceae bacterium]